MKKTALCLILCIIFVFFTYGIYAYADSPASDNVVESPNVKIVIDGKIGTYTDTPIIVNDRTLLPLRAVLSNLGALNDDQHIVWNSSERSVTVYKNSTKIYLKVDSNTAYVNDEPITLDVLPVIYNNRTYIPARFVAQSLGKKVVWNGPLQSVLIRDEQGFNHIKDILDKIDASMKAIPKSKFNMYMKMNVDQSGMKVDLNVNLLGEVDTKKKAMHISAQMPLLGQLISFDTYYANNTEYTKNFASGKWIKKLLSADEYNRVFKENNDSEILDANDLLCAGLVAEDSENPNEIILKGNVYLDEILNQVNENSGASKSKINSVYMKISANRNTNVLNGINMDFSGSLDGDEGEAQYSAKVALAYSDLNGNFDIVLPEGVE